MRTKIMFSVLLVTILLATQVIAVGAAPAKQDTTPPITGTVESIIVETNTETGEKTVVVKLTDELGETQTVRVSLEYATDVLKLVVDEVPIVLDPTVPVVVEIDPDQVITETPEETEGEAQHPVGSALADFFFEFLGVDYDTIMGYHEEGVGFGVIAQALWMTNAINKAGETEMSKEDLAALFGAILDAKQDKNFKDLGVTLPDGSIPQNWGQFRKAVMSDREKAKENLGAIMSGRAENGQGEETQTQEQIQNQNEFQGNGNNGVGNDNGNNGNGNGPDKEKNNNWKNNNKDKGKGNNH